MSLVDDIKQLLINNNITTAIAKADMPDTPDDLICLFQYAGQNNITFDRITRPNLQIQIRSASYGFAMEEAERIQNILWQIGDEMNESEYSGGVEINDMLYLVIEPVQSPFLLRKDEKERKIIIQNFRTVRRKLDE